MTTRDEAQAWRAVVDFGGRDVPLATAMKRTTLLIEAAEIARIYLVQDMRRDGWSWAEIGESLGMSRQGARQRYGGE